MVTPETARAADPRYRGAVVTFPSDFSIANLYLRPYTGQWSKARDLRLAARGRVIIPEGYKINVEMTYDGVEHAELIDRLPPAAVDRFSADKLDFSDADVLHLKRFANLRELFLGDTQITDKALPTIATLTNLYRLELGCTGITGNGIESLNKISALRSLHLQGLELKPGTMEKLTGSAQSITVLSLSRCHLSDEEMKTVGKFTALTQLSIDGNPKISDRGAKNLASMPNLVSLDIMDTSITEKSLPILMGLKKLKKIMVRPNQFWTKSKPRNQVGNIVFEKLSDHIQVPMEMFAPLH
ncbi:MAG: hypothetical protein KGS72_15990 [Cyanobacteria bacterium REEB67]|nr:hypothetical protein [Cyanobacteria bacterium REEB67]